MLGIPPALIQGIPWSNSTSQVPQKWGRDRSATLSQEEIPCGERAFPWTDSRSQGIYSPLLGQKDFLQDPFLPLGLSKTFPASAARDDEGSGEIEEFGINPGHFLLHGVVAEAPGRLEGVSILQHLPLGRFLKILDLVDIDYREGTTASPQKLGDTAGGGTHTHTGKGRDSPRSVSSNSK